MNRLMAATLLLTTASALPLWSQNQSQTPAKDAQKFAVVEGVITSSPDGQKVKKVQVHLYPSGSGMMATAVTDAEGVFRFESVVPGVYRVRAEKPGFVFTNYGAHRPLAMGTQFRVNAGTTYSGINMQIAPQAVVTGHIVDEDGDPLPQVMVHVMRQAYQHGARQLVGAGSSSTDDHGDYKLQNLQPGQYFFLARPLRFNQTADTKGPDGKIRTVREEYTSLWYPSSADQSGAVAVDVRAGQDVPAVNFQLHKHRVYHIRGALSGSVPADQQLQVMLSPRVVNGGLPIFGGSTRLRPGQTTFDIGDAEPGSYVLILSGLAGPYRLIAQQEVSVGDHDVNNVNIAVPAPIALRGSLTITGTDPASSTSTSPAPPISNAHIMLMPESGMVMTANTTVNPDTLSFTFDQVPPARYTVNVQALRDAYVKSIRFGDQEVLDSGLDLTNGGSAELAVTVSLDGGSVDGNIKPPASWAAAAAAAAAPPPAATTQKDQPTAAAPAPATTPGVMVVLIPEAQPNAVAKPQARLAMADQTGHFIFNALRPGQYHAFALEEPENGVWEDPAFLKAHDSSAVAINVAERSRNSIEVPVVTADAQAEARARTGH